MKKNIYVLCGGKSVEHAISLRSATAVINSIDKDKYNVHCVYITNDGVWCYHGLMVEEIKQPEDLILTSEESISTSMGHFLSNHFKPEEDNLIFPVLHGCFGEDGTIQGFLELLDVPYVGNGVLSSAVGMDKLVAKDLFKEHKIPQVPYLGVYRHVFEQAKEDQYELAETKIGYPIYVKPSNSGSSVGISRVENREELAKAFELAFKYDNKIVVEKEAVAREMQVSVVGNNEPKVSLPGEFIMERAFFDYKAKYIDGKLIPVIPAKLTDDTTEAVRKLAVDTYKVLNCNGLARVDIFVDGDNNIFVNEVNTMPGFTSFSMTPVLWGATDGITYSELVVELMELAVERYNERKKLSFTHSN